MINIIKYSWLLKPYNLLKKFFFNIDIKCNVLLQTPIGIEENKLINLIIKTLLCSNFNKSQKICEVCNNCTYFMQYNSHPDLYWLMIDNLNNNLMDNLIVFSQSLPVFLPYKIIVIVYECEIVEKKIINFVINLFKIININNVKILVKLNLIYKENFYLHLFKNCINIKINTPTECEALSFLKQNALINKYKDVQILTAIRLNKNVLSKTMLFLNKTWSIYLKFSMVFITNIKKENWDGVFMFILNDILNINYYLYWLETYILDIYKITLHTKTNIICNYYFIKELLIIFKFNKINFNFHNSILVLEDINKYNDLITKFPFLNKELYILDLYLKWKLKSNNSL